MRRGATVIRTAEEGDRGPIIALVQQAFTNSGGNGREEVAIVRETWGRRATPPGTELVADDDHEIVGHVLTALGDLDGSPVPGIAPLSVTPDRQGQGIGTALMAELLVRLEAGGWPMVLLLGDPSYYSRFGFEPAGEYGITYPPVGPGNAHFMVRILSDSPIRTETVFAYCWEKAEVEGNL